MTTTSDQRRKAHHTESLWNSLAATFRRVNSALCNKDIAVNVATSKEAVAMLGDGHVPAWSSSTAVWLNRSVLASPVDTDSLISVMGANYHEVSHIKFSPVIPGSDWEAPFRAEGLFPYFNMLEDQKIEMWFVAEYGVAKDYFSMMFTTYLLTNEQQWDTCFPLSHGRKYIDAAIRDELEARYIKRLLGHVGKSKAEADKVVANIKTVIEYYQTLAYPSDKDEMLWCYREFQRLLTDASESSIPSNIVDAMADHACSQDKVNEKGVKQRGKPAASQSEQEDRADDHDQQHGHGESNDSDYDDIKEEAGNGSGKGSAEEEADASDGSGAGSAAEGEGGGDGDSPDSDDASDGGKPGGKSGTSTKPNDVVRDLIEQANAQARQSEVVHDDVQDKVRSIRAGAEGLDPNAARLGYRRYNVTQDMRDAAARAKREFEKSRRRLEDGWEYEQSRGIIDVHKAMRRDPDPRTMFKRWEPGNTEGVSYEIVLVCDHSSSMNGARIANVSEAVWVLRTALKSLDHRISVIGFNTDKTIMVLPGEKVSSETYEMFNVGGGTDPRLALKEAEKVFATSRRPQKVCIILTDDEWYVGRGDGNQFDSIDMMKEWGVALAMLGYGLDVKPRGCHVSRQISSADDLVDVVRSLVLLLMKQVKR